MGTNFYVHIPGEDEPWHLGKRSAGWPFLLHAEVYWDKSLALRTWMARALSGQIKDEYGRLIEFGDLFFQILEQQRYATRHPGSFYDEGLQFIAEEFC